jgi:hypothetical protein
VVNPNKIKLVTNKIKIIVKDEITREKSARGGKDDSAVDVDSNPTLQPVIMYG